MKVTDVYSRYYAQKKHDRVPDGAKLIGGFLNFLSRWQAAPAWLLPHASTTKLLDLMKIHANGDLLASEVSADRRKSAGIAWDGQAATPHSRQHAVNNVRDIENSFTNVQQHVQTCPLWLKCISLHVLHLVSLVPNRNMCCYCAKLTSC